MDYLKILETLTDLKKDSMNRLLELTQEQRESINNKDTDMLLKLVEEKQTIIEKIDKYDREYEETFKAMKESVGSNSPKVLNESDFKKLQEKTKDLLSIINMIQDLEAENSRKIKEQISHLKTKIDQVQQGKQSLKAYGTIPQGSRGFDSHFIDKKR